MNEPNLLTTLKKPMELSYLKFDRNPRRNNTPLKDSLEETSPKNSLPQKNTDKKIASIQEESDEKESIREILGGGRKAASSLRFNKDDTNRKASVGKLSSKKSEDFDDDQFDSSRKSTGRSLSPFERKLRTPSHDDDDDDEFDLKKK